MMYNIINCCLRHHHTATTIMYLLSDLRLYTLCSRIIFHSKKAEDNNNKSTQPPPPHPTMKFNHFKLLLSTSAVIATAPLVSGQVSVLCIRLIILGLASAFASVYCYNRLSLSSHHLLIFLHNLIG